MKTTSQGTKVTNDSIRAWEHKRKQNIVRHYPILNASPAALHRVFLIESLGFTIDGATVDREFRQSFDRAFIADMDALANLVDTIKFELTAEQRDAEIYEKEWRDTYASLLP